MMSQRERVEGALRTGASMTQWDTFHWKPPIMRLGAIVFNLREDGWEVSTDTVESPGGAKVASYRLVRLPSDSPNIDRRKKISDGLY